VAQCRSGRRRRAERGQSIVEFSLVLPVALLILALVVDVGQYIVGSINLNQVARASATAASFSADHGGTLLEVESQAVNAATTDEPSVTYAYCTPLVPPCVNVTQTTTGAAAVPVEEVTVYRAIAPLVPLLPSLTLQASAAAAY